MKKIVLTIALSATALLLVGVTLIIVNARVNDEPTERCNPIAEMEGSC